MLKSALLIVWFVPQLAFTWKILCLVGSSIIFSSFIIFVDALEGAEERGNTGDACRTQVPVQ